MWQPTNPHTIQRLKQVFISPLNKLCNLFFAICAKKIEGVIRGYLFLQ